MADTYQSYSNAGQTTFSVPFPYLNKSHVKVYKGRDIVADTQTATLAETSGYTFNTSGTQITLTSALGSGEVLTIERQTPSASQLSPWSDGSNLTAEELNNADLQNLYIVQEQKDRNSLGATEARSATNNSASATATANAAQATANAALSRGGGTMTGDIVMGGNRITGLTNPASGSEPVIKSYFEAQSWDNTTETIDSTETWAGDNTKIATTGSIDGRIDSKIDTAIEGDVLAGTDLTKTQTGGQVTFNHSVTGASSVNNSNGVVLQDLTINPRGHITGHASIDLDTRYYKETELDAGQLDNRYFTETELLTNGVLDTRYFTQTAADARFYNLDSGEEIRSGETWSAADNKIATTAAIDARIIDLVNDVGGFVPIANETSFPAANPDVNNDAGTLVSVQVLAGSHTPSGGSITISNGAGTGNNVTISGVGSTTLPAGFGVILETTSTLHTYTFHRLTPKATEVTTVAGNNSNITTVATNIADITTVANDLNETTSEIETVANAITNVNNVGNSIANVNTAATNIANINTVASDLNETTSEIDTVATNIANVNTVGGAIANVNTVASDLNETTSEINTVAVNIANVNTVGNAITNVNNVGGSIANVNTVATNLTDVSNYADRYQIASSDPTTRADSSALQEGDQYFNTTANVLKVYDGSNWNTGVTDTTGFAVSTGQTFTGNVGVPAANNSAPGLFIAGDTDTGIYSPGTNLLAITASGTKVLEVGSSGIDITGSVTATSFSGSGASLTSLPAGNLTGTVADARISTLTASKLTGALPAISGANLTNVNATTLDSIDSGSFLRSDADDTATGVLTLTSSSGYPLNINGSNNAKIVLQGSTAPYIRWREGTTDKAYIQWQTSGQLYIANEEDNSGLLIKDELSFTSDGSNFHKVWHAGNDGSGSGLDADTLDGVQGSNYLRSDTSDTFNGVLTINENGDDNLILQGTSHSRIKFLEGSTYRGYIGYDVNENGYWFWNAEQSRGIRLNSAITFYDGSAHRHMLHQGNVGSGGALSSSSVYISQLYNASILHQYNWLYFEATGNGLYWNGGSGAGWHINPQTNYRMKMRSGHSNASVLSFRNSGDTVLGTVYSDSSGIGFTNANEGWVGRTSSGSSTSFYFYGGVYPIGNGTQDLGNSGSKWNQVHADEFHGDGSNLTNLPAGGASFTATADGALTAGKAVMVNANGTVKTIAVNTTVNDYNQDPVEVNVEAYIYGGQQQVPSVAYDSGNNKWIASSINAVGSSKYGVVVKSFSNMGYFTGNSEISNFNENAPDQPEARPIAVYSPDNQMTAVFYAGYGQGLMRLIQTTNSATSGGAINTFNTSSAHTWLSTSNQARFIAACYDKSVNKFILAYADDDNSFKGWIQTVTVTGTNSSASVSFGTRTSFMNSDAKWMDLEYDEVNNRSWLVCRNNSNGNILLRAVTTSGTNISLNSTVHTVSSSSNDMSRVAFNSTDNKIAVQWGESNYNRARVGTPNSAGTSITWGSTANIMGSYGQAYHSQLVWEPFSNYFFSSIRTSSDQTKIRIFKLTSGTTINTGGDWTLAFSNQYSNSLSVLPKGHTHTLDGFVVVGTQGSSGINSYLSSLKTTTSHSNLNGPNYFVGFAEQAYSNGATATIKTYGSVVGGFSGLSPGFPYYVQADGTVASTQENSVFWPYGQGFTWDSALNDGSGAALPNGWRPNAYNASQSGTAYQEAPIAGLAVGTDKILLTAYVHKGAPVGTWQDNNHTHG